MTKTAIMLSWPMSFMMTLSLLVNKYKCHLEHYFGAYNFLIFLLFQSPLLLIAYLKHHFQ